MQNVTVIERLMLHSESSKEAKLLLHCFKSKQIDINRILSNKSPEIDHQQQKSLTRFFFLTSQSILFGNTDTQEENNTSNNL